MSNVAQAIGNRSYSIMVGRAPIELQAKRVLGRVWQMVDDAAEMHRAVRHLNRLDDALLRDIGVSRSEVPYCVRQGRFRLVD